MTQPPAFALTPAFREKTAVVFSCDSNYILYLGVCILSLLSHSSPEHTYDILILYDSLPTDAQNKLQTFLRRPNASIRFVNISEFIKHRTLWTCHHFTQAMYYRFLIPSLFARYDKVIYSDCDCIFNADVAELYSVDFQRNWLAAVRDTEAVRCAMHDNRFGVYAKEKLKLTCLTDYFQSGFLIYNITALKQTDFENRCWQKLEELGTPSWPDQDVLNAVAQGHVMFLDNAWNVEWHVPFRSGFQGQLPGGFAKDYEKAYASPKLIHYSSGQKAWSFPNLPLAEYFWHYARQTPFYEEILFKNIPGKFPKGLSYHLLKLLADRRRILTRYYRCKILSKLTWGQKRTYYRQKSDALHEQVRQIRTFLKN